VSFPAEANGERLFFALSARELEDMSEFLQVIRKLKRSASRQEMDLKWTAPQNRHLTLVFLGDRKVEERSQLIEIGRHVAASLRPVELDLRNVGAFPEVQSARVIWLGVANTLELRSMRSKLANELKMEVSPEEFVPHVTLARSRSLKNVKNLISPVVRSPVGQIMARELILYKSEIFGSQVVYTPMERFPFPI